MTIEEKAKEYANENINVHNNGLRGVLKATGRITFTAGANWMLEKAAYWLQEHVNNYLFDDGVPGRPWLKCKSDMFDDFRKAMEE